MSEKNYIQSILDAVNAWLRPDNQNLQQAIDRTVNEGYFSFPDVKNQILSLKQALNESDIRKWVEQSGLKPGSCRNRKVLCLHAGNIPLVGLQDALAVLLSGSTYIGKISRKDPWLLPSFLEEVQKADLNHVAWSTDLRTLKDSRADAVLFSGSARSVEGVYQSIDKLNLVKDEARSLIRTAYYSLAYIDNTQPKTMEDLAEAVFRYGGRGCRSVAVVISPFNLDDEKCMFTDYVEGFWLNHPQHLKPAPSLYHRYAYNKAVGHSQAWLDDFLIEETEMKPNEEFVLHWVRGEADKVCEFVNKYETGLQSVYVSHSGVKIPGLKRKTELLSRAQSPPIHWKPDGTDTLKWLRRLESDNWQ